MNMLAIDPKTLHCTGGDLCEQLHGPRFIKLIKETANIVIVKTLRTDRLAQSQLGILILKQFF
jgi:hypothetical protein